MNQTMEVLTDAHMLSHVGTLNSTGPSPPSKSTANLGNRICLSNSDFEVQSAGYNSAQSPTNWESIHGKDPGILCAPSSHLTIALDDKNPKCEIQDCELTCETCTNLLDTKCFSKIQRICYQHNYIFLQFLWDKGLCKTAWNMRCVRWCHYKRSFI